MKKFSLLCATALAAGAGVLATPATASAAPDTSCQKAGMTTLRSAGLLDDVARGGLPIAAAQGLGVTVREGADISGLPAVLPLRTVLADHRAGDASLFVYPWCA